MDVRSIKLGEHALLAVSCALLAVQACADCANLVQGCALWTSTQAPADSVERPLLAADVLVNLLCIVLEAVCVARATHVVRMRREDTHDHVATSQLCAIALVGLSVVEWGVARLVNDDLQSTQTLSLALGLVPPLLYYGAVGRESHSHFWRGIRRGEESAPQVDAPFLPRWLALAPEGGLLVAQGNAAAAQVRVCSLGEFVCDHEGENLARHAERLFAHVSRTAVYPLGNGVLGTLYVPEEKLAMTGPALGGAARLGFALDPAELVLLADDEPTRRLLAWYLDGQYLTKSDPGEVLVELQELLIEDDADDLQDLDHRIDALEASLSEGVTEVPRDFSDYINDTRSDLGAIEKFYRQVADAAEDAIADDVLVGTRERHLLAGLSRRAGTLADDARDLRDNLAQVREGYQERIDVRQNGIMSILTIVTSISTPIALLTSWYGMNFDSMSELHYEDAYSVVTIVAVVIVTLEVLYFKRKRWF